ncbi:hypothetical protein EQ500_05345 [Lactobacillus sp. XV13L]|nr:hypothetical protein [Lactobacillus sp. XV13L]
MEGRDADKFIYLYKRIQHDPVNQKMRVLGLQGATSGTNSNTLQSQATKTANIKGVGSSNQQRVVDVIWQSPVKGVLDLYWDLYAAWEKKELIGLWRVDLNTVRGKKPDRTVEAEYGQCYMPQLPTTEALGGTASSNITFEVNGMTRAINNQERPFVLLEKYLPDGFFDAVSKFINFSYGVDIGMEDDEFTDKTVDDDTIPTRDPITGEDVDENGNPINQSGNSTPSGGNSGSGSNTSPTSPNTPTNP